MDNDVVRMKSMMKIDLLLLRLRSTERSCNYFPAYALVFLRTTNIFVFQIRIFVQLYYHRHSDLLCENPGRRLHKERRTGLHQLADLLVDGHTRGSDGRVFDVRRRHDGQDYREKSVRWHSAHLVATDVVGRRVGRL